MKYYKTVIFNLEQLTFMCNKNALGLSQETVIGLHFSSIYKWHEQVLGAKLFTENVKYQGTPDFFPQG